MYMDTFGGPLLIYDTKRVKWNSSKSNTGQNMEKGHLDTEKLSHTYHGIIYPIEETPTIDPGIKRDTF